MTTLEVLGGIALGVGAYELIAGGSGSSGSSNNCGPVNCSSNEGCCQSGGPPEVKGVCCPNGYPVYCPATGKCQTGPDASGPCDVNGTVVCFVAVGRTSAPSGSEPIRNVRELVARGFAPPRNDARASTLSCGARLDQRTTTATASTRTATPSLARAPVAHVAGARNIPAMSGTSGARDVLVRALEVGLAAWTRWTRASSLGTTHALRVAPWANSNGAGVDIGARF
jgi:hypothetical protein